MSYLVIHGQDVWARDVKKIAKLSGATRIENIRNNAFRLHEYKAQEGVAEFCAKAKLDFAFVPEPRRLSDFGLVAMDMDSTLITIECIDEIADLQGIKPEVAAITASAMRGEIEYPESLRGSMNRRCCASTKSGCAFRPAPSACSSACAPSGSRHCSSPADSASSPNG
jgi:phosphoserine phosphatase